MDASESAVSSHARSNSLPSRPNPTLPQAEECLNRLRSSAATSTSTIISLRLNSLQELHDCVDELLLLPLTQQAIAHEPVDELLEGSLILLDACSIVKEGLLQTRESAQEIQSVLRRKCDAESEVRKFTCTRKLVKRAIQKALKSFKNMGNKCSSGNEKNVIVLREAQAHNALAFQSLLYFINVEKASSRSLVSKITRSKRVTSQESEDNEFAKVDAAVHSFIGGKGSAENVKNQLKELDLCIQDFEDGVESLFRRLIKTRVLLLNIINR